MTTLAKGYHQAGDLKSLTELVRHIPRSALFDKREKRPEGSWDRLLRILENSADVEYDGLGEMFQYTQAVGYALYVCTHVWQTPQLTKDVIFLDIDGVLQGDWTWPAYGFYYGNCHRFLWDPGAVVSRFDQHFLSFLQGLCREAGVSVVLCSTWRGILKHGLLDMFAHHMGLPIAGATHHRGPTREDEILDFITENPIIRTSVTLDDEHYDVGARLRKNPISDREGYIVENTHVRICAIEGPRVKQMRHIAEIFGTTFDDVCRNNRLFRKEREE